MPPKWNSEKCEAKERRERQALTKLCQSCGLSVLSDPNKAVGSADFAAENADGGDDNRMHAGLPASSPETASQIHAFHTLLMTLLAAAARPQEGPTSLQRQL